MTGISNFTLRLPVSMKRELEKMALEADTSVREFIISAIAEKLATKHTADFFNERASRANVQGALAIMERAGRGEQPMKGDEL